MWAMVLKEFRELRRDRRTVAMLVVLPILLLVVFGYAANFTVSKIDTEVFGPQAQQLAAQAHAPLHVTGVDPAGTRTDAEHALRDNRADVAIVTSGSGAPVRSSTGRRCSPRRARSARSATPAMPSRSTCSTTPT